MARIVKCKMYSNYKHIIYLRNKRDSVISIPGNEASILHVYNPLTSGLLNQQNLANLVDISWCQYITNWNRM